MSRKIGSQRLNEVQKASWDVFSRRKIWSERHGDVEISELLRFDKELVHRWGVVQPFPDV